MGLQDFGVIMNYLQIFFTNKWHKKTCPQEVQLAFGIVLKKGCGIVVYQVLCYLCSPETNNKT